MTPVALTIYGPNADGTYIVEFRTAEGEALAISIPRAEAAVIRHFQAKMPYGLGRASAGHAKRQKATREPGRVAFETNCRVDPGSVRRLEILTNSDASGSGIRPARRRRASVGLATHRTRAEPHGLSHP